MKKLFLLFLLLVPSLTLGQQNPDIRFHHNGEGLFLLEINADKTSELEFDFGDNISDIFRTQTPNQGLMYLGMYKKDQPTLLKLSGKTPNGPIASSIVLDFGNEIFTQSELAGDIQTLWNDATGDETPEKSPWWTNVFPLLLVILGIMIIVAGFRFSRKEPSGNDLLPEDFWDDKKKTIDPPAKTKHNHDLPFEVIEKK